MLSETELLVQILQPTSLLHEKPDPWELSHIISKPKLNLQTKKCIRMISEIMLVPFPRAASSRFMSFLTFHISMLFSASLAGCPLMMNRYHVHFSCVFVRKSLLRTLGLSIPMVCSFILNNILLQTQCSKLA